MINGIVNPAMKGIGAKAYIERSYLSVKIAIKYAATRLSAALIKIVAMKEVVLLFIFSFRLVALPTIPA